MNFLKTKGFSVFNCYLSGRFVSGEASRDTDSLKMTKAEPVLVESTGHPNAGRSPRYNDGASCKFLFVSHDSLPRHLPKHMWSLKEQASAFIASETHLFHEAEGNIVKWNYLLRLYAEVMKMSTMMNGWVDVIISDWNVKCCEEMHVQQLQEARRIGAESNIVAFTPCS